MISPAFKKGPKVADLLKRDSNIFDGLRLLAAIAVIYSHSYSLTGHESPHLFGVSLGRLAVYTFFVLSGLLISASWTSHPRVAPYLAKRILRIIPALAVVILLCAFVLGPIITQLSLHEYFASNQTYKYLNGISLFGLEFVLPGVLATSIYGASVNGSIWTLPYEFLAYLGVALLGKLRKLTNARFLAGLFVGDIILFFVVQKYAQHIVVANLELYFIFLFSAFFIAGMILYALRDKIVLNWLGAGLCTVAIVVAELVHHPRMALFIAMPYLVLFLGSLTWTGLSRLSQIGDFSYGTYIYAWPVQRVIVEMHHNAIGPKRLFVYATAITFVFAFASWHLIEKPALRMKKYFTLKKYPVLEDAW